MFGRLFNKKASVPALSYLAAYSNKGKYFVRTAHWDWLSKTEIYVMRAIDGKPGMHTMDFWLQEIFLDADGQITVAELIVKACKQLTDSKLAIPANVDEYLISELERLVNELQVVEFCDEKTVLPDNIALPISKHSTG